MDQSKEKMKSNDLRGLTSVWIESSGRFYEELLTVRPRVCLAENRCNARFRTTHGDYIIGGNLLRITDANKFFGEENFFDVYIKAIEWL